MTHDNFKVHTRGNLRTINCVTLPRALIERAEHGGILQSSKTLRGVILDETTLREVVLDFVGSKPIKTATYVMHGVYIDVVRSKAGAMAVMANSVHAVEHYVSLGDLQNAYIRTRVLIDMERYTLSA